MLILGSRIAMLRSRQVLRCCRQGKTKRDGWKGDWESKDEEQKDNKIKTMIESKAGMEWNANSL